MHRNDPRLRFDLGQRVYHRDDPMLLGYVIAVLLVQPYEVLVHWRRRERASFEPIDALLEVLGEPSASRSPIPAAKHSAPAGPT
jgi:hypothetical protein